MTEPPAPAPPYQPDGPPATPSKPRRSVSLLVAVLIALGVGLVSCLAGIGAGGTNTATKTSVSYAPSPYPVVSTVEHTVTVTVAPPPPPGPATSLSEDGTYLVGSDISPGMYRANSITSNNCYWARLKSTDTQDILGNDNVSPGGQAIVTIKASDKAFETQGCGTWQKIG